MPYKIRKTKCKKSDGSSGTHVVYKKSGKRVGCTDDPEDYKKALYAAEVNEDLILEDTLYKNVEDDVFLHFTLRDRAYKIREMGVLLRQPEGIKKFGTDTIDAVSLIWGDFVPGVQTTHLGDEDIVAIIFKTDVPPKYGYVEEVKWDVERLPIYDVRIVPFEEATQMLRNAPEHIDEMDYVLYKESKNMNIEELSAIILEEVRLALEEAKKKKKKKKKKKSKKKKGKDDRCTRIAKRKYDVWPSAYASGAVVQCRRGKIWKGLTEELNEAAGEGDIKQKLSQLAKGDQELRQIWAIRLKAAGGWSEELVDEFAKEHGTDKEDLFGDHSRQEEFKKLFNMMSDADYNNFSDQNWDHFHIIVQHMDKDIDIQKKAREVLKRHNRTEQYQYLDDRINCAEFGKQLYGTQNGCEKVDTLQERRRRRNIWKGLTEEREITPEDKETIADIVTKLRAASESHAQMAKDLEDGAAKLEKGSEAHSSQADKLEKMIQERKKKKKKKAKKKVKTDFSKEKDKGLHGWFERQGGKGKSKGWVDCNTCRTDKKTGKKTCKSCGRQKGEKRAKYPSCRPTPAACGSKGKGKSWGKKSAKKGKKK